MKILGVDINFDDDDDRHLVVELTEITTKVAKYYRQRIKDFIEDINTLKVEVGALKHNLKEKEEKIRILETLLKEVKPKNKNGSRRKPVKR